MTGCCRPAKAARGHRPPAARSSPPSQKPPNRRRPSARWPITTSISLFFATPEVGARAVAPTTSRGTRCAADRGPGRLAFSAAGLDRLALRNSGSASVSSSRSITTTVLVASKRRCSRHRTRSDQVPAVHRTPAGSASVAQLRSSFSMSPCRKHAATPCHETRPKRSECAPIHGRRTPASSPWSGGQNRHKSRVRNWGQIGSDRPRDMRRALLVLVALTVSATIAFAATAAAIEPILGPKAYPYLRDGLHGTKGVRSSRIRSSMAVIPPGSCAASIGIAGVARSRAASA